MIRAEPARVTDWAARSIGAAWRAFDLQMAAYAALLVAIGLVMAYSNSAEQGRSILEGGTTFVRGLMWTGIALIVYIVATSFDYKWLKTFSWPLYALQLGLLVTTLAIGHGVGGSARWVSIGPFDFQFSELAKILMIVVLANYLGARQGRLGSLSSIVGACILVVPPVDPRDDPAGPGNVARAPRDPRRHALHVRRQPPLARRCSSAARWRRSRSSGPTSCATTRSSGSSASSIQRRTSRARATSCSSRRSRSARVAGSARA